VPCCIKGFFDIQVYHSRRHVIVEIVDHIVRKPHTLQYRAMTCTETKLTFIKQVSHFSVPFGYFWNYFFQKLARNGHDACQTYILRKFRVFAEFR
jgi:hypothetical protein